jgi:hypothetical protein
MVEKPSRAWRALAWADAARPILRRRPSLVLCGGACAQECAQERHLRGSSHARERNAAERARTRARKHAQAHAARHAHAWADAALGGEGGHAPPRKRAPTCARTRPRNATGGRIHSDPARTPRLSPPVRTSRNRSIARGKRGGDPARTPPVRMRPNRGYPAGSARCRPSPAGRRRGRIDQGSDRAACDSDKEGPSDRC